MPISRTPSGPDSAESTSRTLLDRVRAWDPAAWDRLIALYGPLVHHWLSKSQLQSHDAADVAQEVFRAVANSIGDFRRDRPTDRFRAWLKTITQNKVRDHFRNLARRPPAEGGSDAHRRLLEQAETIALPEDAEDQVAAEVYLRAVSLIQTEFEETTWKAFWQTVVEQQPTANLGMSSAAVLMAKSRVRRRLRDEFDAVLE